MSGPETATLSIGGVDVPVFGVEYGVERAEAAAALVPDGYAMASPVKFEFETSVQMNRRTWHRFVLCVTGCLRSMQRRTKAKRDVSQADREIRRAFLDTVRRARPGQFGQRGRERRHRRLVRAAERRAAKCVLDAGHAGDCARVKP